MNHYDKAHHIADKIKSLGDYEKEAARILKDQAEQIKALRATVHSVGSEGLSEHDCLAQEIDFASFELGCNETTRIISQRMQNISAQIPNIVYVSGATDPIKLEANARRYFCNEG